MKTYCALGLGNNFFYPLGTDILPIPPTLLQDESRKDHKDDDLHHSSHSITDDTAISTDQDEAQDKTIEEKDSSSDDDIEKVKYTGTKASLLSINPNSSNSCEQIIIEEDQEFSSAGDWLQSHLPSTKSGNDNAIKTTDSKYSTNVKPIISCGATHTSIIVPSEYGNTSSSLSKQQQPKGEAHLVGTIFGRTYHKLTIQPTRLPLKVVRISSGRRHVLALTEGTSPAGGVVMSWGAGHFGQLGHGLDLTSCLEPRIIERLLPHVVGGNIIEIAAGGLHSAAIVASTTSSTTKQKVFPSPFTSNSTNGDNSKETIVIRETKTFAWGSNRKGQCGIEGGKCATVPEPLPVVLVKRGEISKKDNSKTDPVDKNVHFEKLSLGRLHTVALTAYGEVFTWGSTSMGRCGHSSIDSGRGSDRRFIQQPRHVNALRNVAVEAIAAGAAHTLALSKGGRVFAWGAGSDGQCGQGHAGNLFSPRAVQGLPSSVGSKLKVTSTAVEGNMPHVNSKVAMAVTMEEEELSKQLESANISPPVPGQRKTGKIVAIRASGCYSAAITSEGALYTWGYGAGPGIGHPIPPENTSNLPLIPIIEGNQYSTSTAAKVYPEGGSDDNKIQNCKCFDTDLNIMLPRKVECTDTLDLRVEDVSMGPAHMVIICSTGDSSDDDNRILNSSEFSSEAATQIENRGLLESAADELSSLRGGDAYITSNAASGDIGTTATFDSHESSKSEKKRRSPGWMTKMKSSRSSNKQQPSNTPPALSSSPPDSGDKKKPSSIRQMGKILGEEVKGISKALRRSGDK